MIKRRDSVQEAQQARLFRSVIPNPTPGALQDAFCPVGPSDDRGIDRRGQIKLTIAVGVRAWESKKCPGRWI